MIQAQASFISEVQTTFPSSKPVMELNQNHRFDHSLNIWASLDVQPSTMYSLNLLIGPHLSPKSKCCWKCRLFFVMKVIQSSISRRRMTWGTLVLTKSNHSWPFSKQNRKKKLESYSSCVWTEDFILIQNSPGKHHSLGQNSEILQGEEMIYVFEDLSWRGLRFLFG